MTFNVGAIATIYEKHKVASVEAIKSFRHHNPDSSIVICSDGLVSDIHKICEEYNCDLIMYRQHVGYPASKDINLPRTYLFRFLTAARLIKEKYFLNLEPDVLVTDKISISTDKNDCTVVGYTQPYWLFELDSNLPHGERMTLIDAVIGYYSNKNVLNNRDHDYVLCGGGYILSTKLALDITNNWQNFVDITDDIDSFYKSNLKSIDFIWYSDYLLSTTLPFYGKWYKDETLSEKIIEPYKNFY